MIGNYHTMQRDIAKCYRSDSLEGRIKRAEDKLAEAQEVIGDYISAVREQATKIAATTFHKEVHLERREGRYSWDKGIRYEVSLRHIPEVPDFYEFGFEYPITDRKEFDGRERGTAIKYAESLAATHNCPLVKTGFSKEGSK